MGRIARIAILAIFAAVFAASLRGDIANGTKRAEVVAELGKPTSAARRGNREILLYPKGVRFELENDAVVDVKGYVPPPTPTVALAAKTPVAVAPKSDDDDLSELKPSAMAAGEEYNPAIAANALGDEVAKMNTAWGTREPEPKAPPLDWLLTGLGVLLHFGFTIFALFVAFKYWSMDALWTGTFAIAGIDAALHGILTVLGPYTGGLTTVGGVQASLPGVVMIFTIRHFCFNKNLQDAVLTAGVVKLVVMICGLFVSGALMNLLAG
jgi:hypothetical protein